MVVSCTTSVTVGYATHNWSPLKSPNATILPSVSIPLDPASSREFPLNLLGGNGQIPWAGNGSVSHARLAIRVAHFRSGCPRIVTRVCPERCRRRYIGELREAECRRRYRKSVREKCYWRPAEAVEVTVERDNINGAGRRESAYWPKKETRQHTQTRRCRERFQVARCCLQRRARWRQQRPCLLRRPWK